MGDAPVKIPASPNGDVEPARGYLQEWEVTFPELEQALLENPSLRGFVFGYVAEIRLRELLKKNSQISSIQKFSDHDRRHKNDLALRYREIPFTVEVKSLQTASIRRAGDGWVATFQCDASDRRPVSLPNGETVETTCLKVGEFDLVAVNLFEAERRWQFAFALNVDLPRSNSPKYTTEQQQWLLATSVKITWPLKPPFEPEPWGLLERLVADRTK
jgi:hypothetical protein